jgi:hypothetical protein
MSLSYFDYFLAKTHKFRCSVAHETQYVANRRNVVVKMKVECVLLTFDLHLLRGCLFFKHFGKRFFISLSDGYILFSY